MAFPPRVHQHRHPDMGRSEPRHMGLHRAGQAHAECLHRKLQRAGDELLNETLFTSLAQTRIALECWRADYNDGRPHRSVVSARYDPSVAHGSKCHAHWRRTRRCAAGRPDPRRRTSAFCLVISFVRIAGRQYSRSSPDDC